MMIRAGERDARVLYEQEDFWSLPSGEHVERQRRMVAGLVPAGTVTILDVGCGTGTLPDEARRGRWLVGLDRSAAALRRFRGCAVRGDCARLPFRDHSFDLVVCSEVLEHLSERALRAAVRELDRVAGEALIVSVPYRENLAVATARCAACSRTYHLSGHLRRFRGPGDVVRLFPGWSLREMALCGPSRLRNVQWLDRLRKAITGDWATRSVAVCPYCGGRQTHRRRKNSALRSLAVRVLDRVMWRTQSGPFPRWMVVLLGRGVPEAP